VKIEYKDKAHRYYVREFDPEKKEWGKARQTRGVTTVLDSTLEKKGLMTWPMGMALQELFGFYDFTNSKGDRMTGFSKNKGTLWAGDELAMGSVSTKEALLPLVTSASKAWQRKQKKGADIGSLVHDAIEHYVRELPFEVTVEQYKKGQEFATKEEEYEWLKQAENDVAMANLALGRFIEWWKEQKPELLGAEDLVYSKLFDYCGTFDGLIKLGGKTILADWKTSNASVSAGAPQGVYYSYFIQSAAYAAAWQEMGNEPIDDLLIVSCRKDGSFDTKLLSEVGLTVEEAILWWESVVHCYQMMDTVKKKLKRGL
jgi:hypothetical protein